MRSLLEAPESGRPGGPTPPPDARALALRDAVEALRADRPVAFPTETVWGLAVSARSEAGMAALRAWKGRDAGQPVSVLVSSPDVLRALALALPPLVRRLVDAFWPGPLTLVVPCRLHFAAGVTRADGALGLRCSPHPVARALARAAEDAGLGPLTATSLNRSGDPPAADRAAARSLCRGPGAPHLLDGFGGGSDGAGEDADGAAPTTIVDTTTEPARVLRWGGIDAAALAPFGDAIDTQAGDDDA